MAGNPEVSPVPRDEFRTWLEAAFPQFKDVFCFERGYTGRGREVWVAVDEDGGTAASGLTATGKEIRQMMKMGARRIPEDPDDDIEDVAPLVSLDWSDF